MIEVWTIQRQKPARRERLPQREFVVRAVSPSGAVEREEAVQAVSAEHAAAFAAFRWFPYGSEVCIHVQDGRELPVVVHVFNVRVG